MKIVADIYEEMKIVNFISLAIFMKCTFYVTMHVFRNMKVSKICRKINNICIDVGKFKKKM